jgi:dihydrofolate reductase
MAITYMHAVSSLDGYIADDQDDVGRLHEWYFNGDQPILGDGPFRVSSDSIDYVRGLWQRQSVIVMGRRLFDQTNGWDGHPPAADQVVLVSHRPMPERWQSYENYHHAGSIAEAFAIAQKVAGDGEIGVTAGDIGGQALAEGFIDKVAIDYVPVVFGGGKSYFGVADPSVYLGDPETVVQGRGVLHLVYPVRKA